jgi:hypothetical protein
MALTVSQRLTAVLDNPPPFAAAERAAEHPRELWLVGSLSTNGVKRRRQFKLGDRASRQRAMSGGQTFDDAVG